MTAQFQVPDEVELLEFFGSDPIERSAEDGYFCYAATDVRGLTLHFSFNLHERSVQTTLSLQGASVSSVSHEAADRIALRERELRCDFSALDSRTTLVVALYPLILVVWSALRTQ